MTDIAESTSARLLLLPLGFAAALAGYAALPSIRANPVLLWSVLGAAGALVAWIGVLLFTVVKGRRLFLHVEIRKQHWIQACIHTSIYLYWGLYWDEVYRFAYLILAQLLFAYAFDILLSWSRRESYTLGFGPFPVVLSANLFLWFKPDWFYLQFVTLAAGFAVKELVRWRKDGRWTHIFNPSSFPLAVASLVLILGHWTSTSWVLEISFSQFWPPHMYLFLFLVALPVQFFFGVTSMTLSAVLTAWAFGVAYFHVTGTYFVYDSYIPIAVFLAMLLLFTDPSTSPRTELGRIIFGFLYGASFIALEALGTAFYSKLLAVPLLNLSVRWIDRAAQSNVLRRLDPARLAPALLGRRRNVAYMGVWACVFALMSSVQAVGDDFPGQWLPFWQNACQEGKARACVRLADMENEYCLGGSGWACNELALSLAKVSPPLAQSLMARGCRLRFQPACSNAEGLASGVASPAHAPPTLDDYPIILVGSKGVKLTRASPAELSERACAQGFESACARR
jgi:hypothetical protein